MVPGTVQGDIDRALQSLGRGSYGQPARSTPRPSRSATGSVPSDPPPALRRLVGTWLSNGRPSQPPREWHQRDWIRKVPAYRDVFEALPVRIHRAAVRSAAAGATRDEAGALRALVATMAWGAIDFGYRCEWTLDMLSTPDAGERLLSAARTLAEHGPVEAYRRLHHRGDCHLYRLGESFATKFLHFCQPDGQPLRALILDSLVNDWFVVNTRIEFTTGRGSAAGYETYLRSMHRWADELGCRAEDVEYSVFRKMAIERGSGWGE